ncbi:MULTISPECIES: family 16 glycoside hydrolase [unclassified Crossiella]|uniref:family 16 glycoside hydrolase n=1 Tax=unclassified Crossiella TaxID=2620835 RepID=UPI001FFF268F|nr:MULTISPECIES: family 16 glycoside hydrolase [unclassified Crossiella]MCK2237456.1 DUF1080 domain-containing protein [Crossiella sp. S99.2]MCK2251111.1 DUF1080 domain-containing protein [Crossiella sp. S99.1]
MLRRPLWTLLAGIVLLGTAFTPPAAADPVLKPMFDGKTLDGWTASKPGEYLVKDGAIHSTGKSRGWLYYNKQQAGTFRWLFHLRQVKGNHAPSVLIWGVTQPINGLGAIQFQPPNGGHWDYRPGHNNSGKEFFTKYPHPKWDVQKWAQCEIVGNQATGIARMACCPLPAGASKCKATEVLSFKDKKAARVGPLAIQIHNSGIEDEYKNLQLEYPVADPDKLITT